MIIINNIKIRKNLSHNDVFEQTIKKNKIKKEDVLKWYISKKSIDARHKEDIHYNYSICLNLKNESKYNKFPKVHSVHTPEIKVKNLPLKKPVIVGAGPSGLFAAITFVQNGISPIIIEQGECVENRILTVDNFIKNGKLNPLSNVQFGEGGAGTFSDGKLTTGINNPLCKKVLREFVNFGAPEQILYLSKPHIGTDNLVNILKNIRHYIISKGGSFLFNTKVTDLNIKNEKISSVICNTNTEIPTSHLVLAIGHSSRDTFEMLYKKGIQLEKKNFSVGVRIEHLQKDINISQYGTITKLNLPPAEYKLAYHSPSGRSCYTFCMCPGGVVMASSSEENTIVTNGMSRFSRDGINANSAVLVNVVPDDFKDSSPLGGIYFQKDLEEKAFTLGRVKLFCTSSKVRRFYKKQKI